MTKYDVIVVGAGAGGGIIAGVLAEGGKRVLLLERGRNAPRPGDVSRDYLRNQRLSQYGVNAGPSEEHPRAIIGANGQEISIRPHDGGYQNNAAIVGGGTRVYGGQAWRFHPLDFKMASTYGVPVGSSLADWPITFEDLAPYYEKAEWEIGVAGDAEALTASHLPPFNKPYPMPPVMPKSIKNTKLGEGARRLGWKTFPVPITVNSIPRDGRPACMNCSECVGFACPVDAKNGSQNTMIPRGLLTGRCDLVPDSMVASIDQEGGRVVGVTYFNANKESVTVRSDVVVVAGGAVESARLLLLSGLGNDHVGRHLQGHYYVNATGRFEDIINDGCGPGPSIATSEFNHGNDGIIGGGMLADDFPPLPVTFWKRTLPASVPRWGAEAKEWMRKNYLRVTAVTGPIHEIPSPDGRLTLSHEVRDAYGLPVARFSGTTHPETVRTSAFVYTKALQWIKAAGAVEIWGATYGLYLSGGQHQAGTCRMSHDPADGAVDIHCRVHGHDNLYVGDGSVHVTNGGYNPVLTIMALAFRTAEHILKSW